MGRVSSTSTIRTAPGAPTSTRPRGGKKATSTRAAGISTRRCTKSDLNRHNNNKGHKFMRIVLSSSATTLRSYLTDYEAIHPFTTATVEAEYGSDTVTGSVITMAHHGVNDGNPAPCSYPNNGKDYENVEVIGVSHLDLDTVGGIMAIMGAKPDDDGFWALAEFVDLNGAHKLHKSGASKENISRLYAWWAWNEKQPRPERSSEVVDVTEKVLVAIEAIKKILDGDKELLAEGAKFKAEEAELNRRTVEGSFGSVLFRTSRTFVNHLYTTDDGTEYDAVVSYNPKWRSVTLSYANPREGDDANAVVKAAWGPLAGGHKGIAGSPRDRRMNKADGLRLARMLAKRKALYTFLGKLSEGV